MSEEPASVAATVESTREEMRVRDGGEPRVRRIAEATSDERVWRNGPVLRHAALRISQLLLTPDSALETYRDGRKVALDPADLARARAIVERLHDALVGEADTGHELLARVWLAVGGAPDPLAESGSFVARLDVDPTPPRHESPVMSPPVRTPLPVSLQPAFAPPAPSFAPTPVDGPRAWPATFDEETSIADIDHGGAKPLPFERTGPGAHELTIEQFAALSAESEAHPHYRAQVDLKYGIADAQARAAVDQRWRERFQRDHALWARFHELYQAYRGFRK